MARGSGLQLRSFPYSVAFSPDGSRLLIGAWARLHRRHFQLFGTCRKETEDRKIGRSPRKRHTISRRSVQSRRPSNRVPCHSMVPPTSGTDSVNCVGCSARSPRVSNWLDVAADEQDLEMNSAFSPDDRLLATASFDGTVRIWDVGEPLASPPSAAIAAWSEHGDSSPPTTVFSRPRHDGTARLWDTDGVLTATLFPRRDPPRPSRRSVQTMCTWMVEERMVWRACGLQADARNCHA